MKPGFARHAWVVLVTMGFALACTKCSRSTRRDPAERPTPRAGEREELVETIYAEGFKGGWQDWGWSPRETNGAGPARIHFANWGGWIVAKPGLAVGHLGALVFRVQPPRGEAEFLEVRVESGTLSTFPRVKIGPQHKADVGGGWIEVKLPMGELDPDGAPFDRVVFRAFRTIDDEVTLLDAIGFTKSDPLAAVAQRSTRAAYSPDNSSPAEMRIQCDATALPISPLIYGIAFDPRSDDGAARQKLGATIRRWGGNHTSRYNWELHFWNLDFDWLFENVSTRPYTTFFAENEAHDFKSALTLPMLGWVAKDGTSNGFPVSVYGPQRKTDPYRTDAGDGTSTAGIKLAPGPPTRTSVPASPEWVRRWVETIRANDARTGKRSVTQYMLDNEPMLWSETHRDVKPEPLGYDELLERTIAYGTAVRQADPGATIAGPAEWGWTGYFYSAKDMAAGVRLRPDRRAHDDTPLIEWYLRKLREQEEKTGVRVLDVLDLHFYPQAAGVYGGGQGGGTDTKTAELRLRSTRALWDPSYVDESWIKEPVNLLPRMKDWVAKNYPGRGLSIGEWSFGGEGHVTGAMAIAEALGRFAQFGVTSAYYWTFPATGSPGEQGFVAYRNFDGKGGRFLDAYVPTTAPAGASLFASRDVEGKHLVAIAVNMSASTALFAKVDVGSCGRVVSQKTYTYMRGADGFVAVDTQPESGATLDEVLPPWSITVMDVTLAEPMKGSVGR